MTDMIYVVAFPLVPYCKGREVSTRCAVVCKQGNSQKNECVLLMYLLAANQTPIKLPEHRKYLFVAPMTV